ncbi:signal peptidase I [Nocardioides sp. Kera G14]|uniref:signal peptidase I n=1 Tax=Nocardioides sp. Kera G14 TaxID=2884264 RepID=UPI00223931A0|nr:signal peptidase I [Nocardioides sp. Kera G14]
MLVLVVLLVVVIGLTFSVTVSGDSMQPTLHPKDRLEVDLLHRKDVDRFDLVEAVEPGEAKFGGGTDIVKRVIGLPGDQVSIQGGAKPRVLIKPARTDEVFEVSNPTWPSQIGSSTSSCCTATGTASPERAWKTVPPNSYWLLGDNWGGSTDSRVFGFVKESAIKAKLSFRILPKDRFGKLTTDAKLVPAQ